MQRRRQWCCDVGNGSDLSKHFGVVDIVEWLHWLRVARCLGLVGAAVSSLDSANKCLSLYYVTLCYVIVKHVVKNGSQAVFRVVHKVLSANATVSLARRQYTYDTSPASCVLPFLLPLQL